VINFCDGADNTNGIPPSDGGVRRDTRSVLALRAALGMSEKNAQRTLADLTQRKAIKAALTPRAEKPHGRWKWVTK
jgi:hypothetical protein